MKKISNESVLIINNIEECLKDFLIRNENFIIDEGVITMIFKYKGQIYKKSEEYPEGYTLEIIEEQNMIKNMLIHSLFLTMMSISKIDINDYSEKLNKLKSKWKN